VINEILQWLVLVFVLYWLYKHDIAMLGFLQTFDNIRQAAREHYGDDGPRS
jgi:hypothetical protein